jgi:hypothetical protein
MQLLDQIEIDLGTPSDYVTVYIDAWDHSLGRKWLLALNELIDKEYHLEKNYCFLGFSDGARDGKYICEQINHSIACINQANLGYNIDDWFDLENTIDHTMGPVPNKFNNLHRYFEDLQGVSGKMSVFYNLANRKTRWHIRQLNLLCHEFESWALSWRKKHTAPEWQRPSQLMCWLNAPRFVLDEDDYELFGIETINRPLGGVFAGVNKAVGKHHWEVFQDEGRDSRVGELITSTLKPQTEAAGDFDIEWANNPGNFKWQIIALKQFRQWLIINGFDPTDKSLTIGHPQVGQVNLQRSFGTTDYQSIWAQLQQHLNVLSIRTSSSAVTYNYNWTDSDYAEQQIRKLT